MALIFHTLTSNFPLQKPVDVCFYKLKPDTAMCWALFLASKYEVSVSSVGWGMNGMGWFCRLSQSRPSNRGVELEFWWMWKQRNSHPVSFLVRLVSVETIVCYIWWIRSLTASMMGRKITQMSKFFFINSQRRFCFLLRFVLFVFLGRITQKLLNQ